MRAATICVGLTALALIGGACARSRLAWDDPAADPGIAPMAGARADAAMHPMAGASASLGAGRDAGGIAMADAAPRDAALAAPDAASGTATTEVWAGQLWAIAPRLCDPDAPWESAAHVIQPMGHVEPVVLFLDRGDDPAKPSGTIAFGRGELPADPGEAPFALGDSGSFWLCSIQGPSKGGVYTVRNARRSSDRLTFTITPAEIWSEWCGGDVADCQPCRMPLGSYCSNYRWGDVFFDLVISDMAMQGPSLGTHSELRLRRIR
jgi:hypothetical protein